MDTASGLNGRVAVTLVEEEEGNGIGSVSTHLSKIMENPAMFWDHLCRANSATRRDAKAVKYFGEFRSDVQFILLD